MSDKLDIYSKEFLEDRVDSDEITAGDEGFKRIPKSLNRKKEGN